MLLPLLQKAKSKLNLRMVSLFITSTTSLTHP